ncbi:MAG: UDP-3-O-acyl-N-acetylglucosamine deacetylase [Bradymonadia bacterium]
MLRKTIESSQEVHGVALHSGKESIVRLLPKNTGNPAWLINDTPLHQCPIVSSQLSTTIRVGNQTISTVEHLFAALSACGITDIKIETTSAELPILDGSCGAWFNRIQTTTLPGSVIPFELQSPLSLELNHARIRAKSAKTFRAHIKVDFPGYAAELFSGTLQDFPHAMYARTFGYIEDLELLQAQGLAKGATLETVLGLTRDGSDLSGQRAKQAGELAQHKWLDLVGDLSLVGKPIICDVFSELGGHQLNHMLVNRLRDLAW